MRGSPGIDGRGIGTSLITKRPDGDPPGPFYARPTSERDGDSGAKRRRYDISQLVIQR
jgi:hypothetical protein